MKRSHLRKLTRPSTCILALFAFVPPAGSDEHSAQTATLAPMTEAEKYQPCEVEPAVSVPRSIKMSDYATVKSPYNVRIAPAGDRIAYMIGGKAFAMDLEASEPKPLVTDALAIQSFEFSDDGKWIYAIAPPSSSNAAFGSNAAQLWKVSATNETAPRQLTFVKDGVSSMKLSPNGDRLLLELTDPISGAGPDSTGKRPYVVDDIIFKQDGTGYKHTNKRTRIFTLDIANGVLSPATVTNDRDFDASWSHDGSQVAFIREPYPNAKYQTGLWMADIGVPGALQTTRLVDAPGAVRKSPSWSKDGSTIAYLWSSETDGAYAVPQLAVYSLASKTETVLTTQHDRTIQSFQFSPDGQYVYFLYDNSAGQHLSRLKLSDNSIEHLVRGERTVWSFDVSQDGSVVMLMNGLNDSANVWVLKDGELSQLTQFGRDVLSDRAIGDTKKISYTTRSGQVVEAFVTRPPGFSSQKKYPAILRIHGGPVQQRVYGYDFVAQYMAGRGYVVIEPNPPGSTGRGLEYIRHIYRNWGCTDYPDLVQAVDHVMADGYIDPERLAVMGYSYGGYMTNCIIAKTPDKFRAAASGGGHSLVAANYGHDIWLSWYTHELGYPWDHPDRYEALSPILEAGKVKTPTLFLGGEQDWNVPIINAELYYQALKVRGIPTQLVVYPDTDHSAGWTTEFTKDYYCRIGNWLDRYTRK